MGAVRVGQVARVAVAVVAVLAQIALAVYFAGWSLFVVPPPVILALWSLLLATTVAVIWLAIRHTWRAPIVPISSLIALSLIYEFGRANLGWGA
jgi:hypothetical protein